MMYFLDFDRTIFDTDAYYSHLLEQPAIAPLKAEIEKTVATPYSDLGSDSKERKAVWDKVSELVKDGTLSFGPGVLAPFVYKDVFEVLRSLGNEAVIVTHGEVERQRLKIESALAGVVRLTVLYVGEAKKAEYLSKWPGYNGAPAIFVDDRVTELEALAAAFPSMKLFEMRRDGKVGDGRWPVIRSLSELP